MNKLLWIALITAIVATLLIERVDHVVTAMVRDSVPVTAASFFGMPTTNKETEENE